ncbi:MAG: hypothetical protein VCB43_16530, partial [Myxococcota bacterium]
MRWLQHEALESLRQHYGPNQARFDEQAGSLRWLQGRMSGIIAPTEAGLMSFLTANRVLLGLT